MPSEGRGILSPVRLPVPPLQQPFGSFEFTLASRHLHCSGSGAEFLHIGNGSRASHGAGLLPNSITIAARTL